MPRRKPLPTSSPTPPPLLALPRELRQQIYSYLPLPPHPISRPKSHNHAWRATPLSLACTSRRLYIEFAPLYYSQTRFRVGLYGYCDTMAWLDLIGAWGWTAVREVTVRFVTGCRPLFDKVEIGRWGVGLPREWAERMLKERKKGVVRRGMVKREGRWMAVDGKGKRIRRRRVVRRKGGRKG